MPMTSILTIDTATDNCSVALRYNQQLITRAHQGARQHTARVLPMVDELLLEASLSIADLDVIAVTTGPGSFTGLRIGVSIAQGLAYSCDVPIISLDTLEVMTTRFAARTKSSNNVIVALLDARMGDVTWSSYRVDEGGSLCILQSSTLSPLGQLVDYINSVSEPLDCIGSGCELLQDANHCDLPKTVTLHPEMYPDAASMVDLATARFHSEKYSSASDISPDYFRTEINWQKRRLIRQIKV